MHYIINIIPNIMLIFDVLLKKYTLLFKHSFFNVANETNVYSIIVLLEFNLSKLSKCINDYTKNDIKPNNNYKDIKREIKEKSKYVLTYIVWMGLYDKISYSTTRSHA